MRQGNKFGNVNCSRAFFAPRLALHLFHNILILIGTPASSLHLYPTLFSSPTTLIVVLLFPHLILCHPLISPSLFFAPLFLCFSRHLSLLRPPSSYLLLYAHTVSLYLSLLFRFILSMRTHTQGHRLLI